MTSPNPAELELLKNLLEPLLEDFLYWFGRSQTLLETETIDFLGAEKQAEMLSRVQKAREEANIAKQLFHATDGKAGVEMQVIMPWHKLLTECWQVSMRFRREQATKHESEI